MGWILPGVMPESEEWWYVRGFRKWKWKSKWEVCGRSARADG